MNFCGLSSAGALVTQCREDARIWIWELQTHLSTDHLEAATVMKEEDEEEEEGEGGERKERKKGE